MSVQSHTAIPNHEQEEHTEADSSSKRFSIKLAQFYHSHGLADSQENESRLAITHIIEWYIHEDRIIRVYGVIPKKN